jgi:putative transposase
MHRPLPTEVPYLVRYRTATISRRKSGKYYVSILVEDNTKVFPPKVKIESSVGLDYSQEDFYVDSSGRKANYPHYLRSSQDKLSRLQQQMSHCKKNSNKRERLRKRIAILHDNISNSRLDWQYKKAVELCRKFDLISLEDLNLQALAMTGRFGKKIGDNGFGQFRIILEYECLKHGKTFHKVSKRFPSTQTCNECGTQRSVKLRLSEREWICPVCGAHHDRDTNAAKCINKEGHANVTKLVGSAAGPKYKKATKSILDKCR